MRMSNFKFWDWNKKPRTMLRFIKSGDIFCFRLDESRFCFGRIMFKMTVGHLSELFDIVKVSPEVTEYEINNAKRVIEPIIINAYILFDNKLDDGSEWRIIGHQENYVPENIDHIYFAFGIGNDCKKKDCFGNVFPISESE